MTDTPAHHESSDSELSQAIRQGDLGAADELFRRHWASALKHAQRLTGDQGAKAEDLAADALSKVLHLVAEGRGPQGPWGPYLKATMRTLHTDGFRRTSKNVLVSSFEGTNLDTSWSEDPDQRVNVELVTTAFGQLPQRWQEVLWRSAVLNESTQTIANSLGLKPNAVAALAFRAREGLRVLFLAEHLTVASNASCSENLKHLPQYVRGTLGNGVAQRLRAHLDGCRSCSSAVDDLGQVNTSFGATTAIATAASAIATSFGLPSDSLHPTGEQTVPSANARGGVARRVGAVAAVVVGVLVLVVLTQRNPRDSALPVAPSPSSPHGVVAHTDSPRPTGGPVPGGAGVTASASGANVPPRAETSEPIPPNSPRSTLTQSQMNPAPHQWNHVSFSTVFAAKPSASTVRVVLSFRNVSAYLVHRPASGEPWTCGRESRVSDRLDFECRGRLAPNGFSAIEVDLSPTSTGDISVRARAETGSGPRLEASSAEVRIPRSRSRRAPKSKTRMY